MMNVSRMQLIPQHLAEVIQTIREANAKGRGHEKRRATRIELIARVTILPVVNNSLGRQFGALMRDISFTGLGLFLPAAFHGVEDFIVDLPRRQGSLRVLCKVRHSRPLADDIAGVGAEYVRIITDKDPIFSDANSDERRRSIQASILS